MSDYGNRIIYDEYTQRGYASQRTPSVRCHQSRKDYQRLADAVQYLLCGNAVMTIGLDILLVEDDLDTQANLRDILEVDGHRVVVAGTAAEAKSIAAENSVCTVVLDRRLPDGTSEDLIPELRLLLPTVDMIVITGYADLNSTITALRHGVSDYILKPINADVLRSSLNKIARRREVESDLQKEQQFADVILETAEAIILVLDLDARIVRSNACFERITGWAFEEAKGENWFDLFVPEVARECTHEVFAQTIADVKTEGIVNPIRTKDGHERYIRWSNSTLKDESGETSAVLAIGVDITEQVEGERKSLQSQRLAAIGQTITGLAHESRNALQRIQASLEMLQLELQDNPEVQSDLNSIRRASNDIKMLLEEVRAFAAPINLHLEMADLSNVWRRAWKSITPAWEQRDVKFEETLHWEQLIVRVDEVRMEHVFRNLFENALAACSDPVRISVECVCANDETVEIVVSDNGPGLSTDLQEKIFEAFFTTKASGTGLGMPIVQRIVEAHEGKIWTDSSVEKGASFVIRLPRDPKNYRIA